MPFRLLRNGGWRAGDIEIVEHGPLPSPLPEEERQGQEAYWQQMLAANPHLYDGTVAALKSVNWNGGKPQLHLYPASYRTLLYSNLRAREWMENRKSSWLCPVLGVSAVVETADARILLMLRSEAVAEYPGYFDVFGGHIDWREHRRDGRLDVFAAVEDELCAELGVFPTQIETLRCIGLAENRTTGKPELLFSSRLRIAAERVLQTARTATERFEYVRLFHVPSEPTHLRAWIEANARRITPSARANLQAYLDSPAWTADGG